MTPTIILAIAKAVEETCKFLQTPEGQLSLKEARENRAKFGEGWDKFIGGFAKIFGQIHPPSPPASTK